jgi:ComF family protein
MRSLAVFDDFLRVAFHRLKYRGDISLGESLSRPLVNYYKSLEWKAELIAPIPVSKDRLARRGYNQAALIALPFALATGIPYRPGTLIRSRETPSQVGLSAAERRKNLQQAFGAARKSVEGRRILLIDDVTTTGATLEEASRTLVESGAAAVYCLTVARALRATPGREK